MRKFLTIIILTTGVYTNCISQNSFCNNSQLFCTGGLTDSFSAPVNEGNAEFGPNYGCLISQPNPSWYFIQIDQPGNISIDIHSTPSRDIDFICWGPFTDRTLPCITELACTENLGSHHEEGPGGGYPLTYTVDCSYDPSSQEWCYIPNAESGEYYILLITNSSNAACEIVLSSPWQAGDGTSNCSMGGCGVGKITCSVSSCDTLTNQYSITGNMISPPYGPYTGQVTIMDQPSGNSLTFNLPVTNPLPYNLNNIPIDDLQHTITVSYTDAPSCNLSVTYSSLSICAPCNPNAGENLIVCGLEANLNAIELSTDSNTHWIPQAGICFQLINNPNSSITASTYGIYNLVWQINNSYNFMCNNTVTVEFVDPALCTSVFENKALDNFTVFPNPVVNSIFTIDYSSKIFDEIIIKVIDIQGVEVFRKFVSKKTESIEIRMDSSGLINGYYLIEINDGQKLVRKPLVIQHIL